MKKTLPCSTFFGALLFVCLTAYTQEPKIFRVSDFDLNGKVKSCLVLTDYGREEFAFDTLGLLNKWVTRYNDTDYDVTYYRYADGLLKERRDEKYRDGVIDKQTSIAHFYVYDSVQSRRLTETIISYNQELLDQYQYLYDSADGLKKIVRSNEQGIDETIVTRSDYKGEHTITYSINGEVVKTHRENTKITREGDTLKVVLEKNFVDGVGTKASEKRLNTAGQLLEEQQFVYNPDKNSFEPAELTVFHYNEDGVLAREVLTRGNTVTEIEHVYQFDRPEGGNWVKKITMPENEYVTRKIDYYPEKPAMVQEE